MQKQASTMAHRGNIKQHERHAKCDALYLQKMFFWILKKRQILLVLARFLLTVVAVSERVSEYRPTEIVLRVLVNVKASVAWKVGRRDVIANVYL